MNIGKLYQVKQYFWYLYPAKDIATAAINDAAALDDYSAPCATAADENAAWLSNFHNCNVTYISPKDIFCLLEEHGNFLEILSTNGKLGWIYYSEAQEWTEGCIEEVNE